MSPGDEWVDDGDSSYYNTLQPGPGNWSSSESIYDQFEMGYWTHCIAFSYNGDCETPGTATPGKGSAMFLGGMGSASDPSQSYGDIKISDDDMLEILSLLDADQHPQIILK